MADLRGLPVMRACLVLREQKPNRTMWGFDLSSLCQQAPNSAMTSGQTLV